jgi:D-sedoheptulose 7-phosphate isomerase
MISLANNLLRQSIAVKQRFLESGLNEVVNAAEMIAATFLAKKKIMIFGNGGSAADAQHMAAEFINRFLMERPELPALALSTDGSIITAIGNDYDFNEIFSKQIKGLGVEGDIALGISTSGRSPDVLRALSAARSRGLQTIVLVGNYRAEVESLCNLVISIPAEHTPRIQEVHGLVIHIICELVDTILFGSHTQ